MRSLLSIRSFLLTVLLVGFFVFVPMVAQAQEVSGFVICGNEANSPCTISHLFRAVILIINYLISMAGFVAVLFIIIAGVQMVYSQGQQMLGEAKKRLSGAVIGLVIVSVAYITVNTFMEGSLQLGIINGSKIFTNPRAYINQLDATQTERIATDKLAPAESGQGITWPKAPSTPEPSDELNGSEKMYQPEYFATYIDGDCAGESFAIFKNWPIKRVSACAGESQVVSSSKSYYKKGEQFDGFEEVGGRLVPKKFGLEKFSHYENQGAQPNSARMFGNTPGCSSFAIAGCGPTAYSMLLQSLNRRFPADRAQGFLYELQKNPNYLEPWDLGQRFIENGYRRCPQEGGSRRSVVADTFKYYFNGWQMNHVDYVINGYGQRWMEKSAADLQVLKSTMLRHLSLSTGYAVAVVGKGRPFSMEGHFILLWGVCTGESGCHNTGKDYVYVADSYSVTNVALIEVGLLAEQIKSITYVGK